jgi:hypothetical protein
MKSHIGGPSSIVDMDQFSASSFAESVVGDPRTDTSSEGYEVAPQHDYDHESHYLTGQLRVSEDMIMATTKCNDDMHALMADYCWRELVAHGSSDGGFSMDDFHTLRERVSVMRTDYQQLLTNRNNLLRIGEMYHEAMREHGVGGGQTYSGVGEHSRILERYTNNPSRIRVQIRGAS